MSKVSQICIKQWGNIPVKYKLGHFRDAGVEKAIAMVKPDFKAPRGTEVGLVAGGKGVFAAVTGNPDAFVRVRDTLDHSVMVADLLTQVKAYLKKQFPQFG